MSRQDRIAALHQAARERILVLDGSWGVMIQRSDLSDSVGTVSINVVPNPRPATIEATFHATAGNDDAFNVKEGDPMYVKPSERVRIW